MARKVIFTEIADDATYVRYTATEQSKLSGVAAGATAGADWSSNVTNKPTTLSDIESGTSALVSGALQKAGGTMTGAIVLSGAPTEANHPATKSYVDSFVAGFDFQADVDAVVANAETSYPGDGTLPVATTGQRYIIESLGGGIHTDWGTITGLAANDIIQCVSTGPTVFSIVYDVSNASTGTLVWDRDGTTWLNWGGTSWSAFGGLAGVTAGVGLDKLADDIFVKPDITSSDSNLAKVISATSNGVSVKVDNASIRENGSNQLEVFNTVLSKVKTYMHKVTAGEVTAGYFTLPSVPYTRENMTMISPSGSIQVNQTIVGTTGATPDYVVGAQEGVTDDLVFIKNFTYDPTGPNEEVISGLSQLIVENDVFVIQYEV
jgi:hypothetical protein